MERRVKAALEEGRIEDHLPDVRMEKVFSKTSTKQAMIARVRTFDPLATLSDLCCPLSATSSPRPSHQPIRPLRTPRFQKQRPCHLPGSS